MIGKITFVDFRNFGLEADYWLVAIVNQNSVLLVADSRIAFF